MMNDLISNNVTTKWIKIINDVKNYCFIGNEAIAFNLNSYILFKSVTNGGEMFYRAALENGDGISVIAGHKIFPIFAFSERCWNAKIFTISYPDFNKISVFEPKEESIYIGLAFSETEHLIALTGMPDYKLQVWFWRTHDLLISTETEVQTDKQKITCSYSLPLTVAQFAYSRGELIVWEVYGTQKFSKLIKRKIELNFLKLDGPFQDVYSIEGNILIVNKYGDVYYVIPSTGSVNMIIKWNGEKGECETCIAYIRSGILVAGPDGNLKYFKKQKYVWTEVFQVSKGTTLPFISLKGFLDNEVVIGTTSDGEMHKITLSNDGEKLQKTKLHQYDPLYENFVVIYPKGEYIVTVNAQNDIHVLEIQSGQIISEILEEINMNEIILKANPIYPYVTIGNSSGNVYCVSLLHPEDPTLLTEFLLSRQSINFIRFSNNGNFMIVIDVDLNQFLISCQPGTQMSVLHHFKENFIPKEFFIAESRTNLSVMYLVKSENQFRDKILKISIELDDFEAEVERQEFELVAIYNTIIPIFGTTEMVYGIRSNAKVVEMLKLDKDAIKLLDAVDTPHKMKYIEGWNDGRHLVTWSIDGVVAIYNFHKNNKLLSSFVAGSRHNFGIRKAKCDPRSNFAIALDYSGNLICSKLNVELTSDELRMIEEEMNHFEMLVTENFSKTTSGGWPGLSQEFQGNKKFIDLKDEKAYQMEAEESEETKIMLYNKLNDLRRQIEKLLDDNEKSVENERLQIQEFNLDLITTAQKEEEARQERNQQDKKMQDYIEAQTTMNEWIVEKCWNHLVVKGTKLRGMFLNMFIENYPLLPERNEDELKRLELIRAVENSVARNDTFLPWSPIPTVELERLLIKEPGMFELDSKDTTQFVEVTKSLMGSSAHRFILISALHYQQLDVVTFHQMRVEKLLAENELRKLRTEFNKKFDNMHRTKEFSIHSIRFKNDRLRHIQNELKILDELKGLQVGSLIQILDPDFLPDETPDTVISVIESEVCVAPYVSPSVQRVLEEQEAAREKRRRELEADDFRDRALDIMMDGVLEHKWEDEIKKSLKVPDCLVKDKAPEDWTEIDARQVYEYERDLEGLNVERDKYRRMLHEEQKLLEGMLDEEIYRFNYALKELSVEKLKFDMAIGQTEMKLLILALYNFKRITYQKEEIRIRLKMEQLKFNTDRHCQMQGEIQDWIKDIKTNYENLQQKDKTMEKQFKANFNEQCPQAPADQAFKYFKRRPKLQMRAQITSPILLEVAKRVTKSMKLAQHIKLLPPECVEFLSGIDTLDQVSASTTGIDVNSWQVLCKMRRIKIESEFKIKSLGLQLADAESSLLAFIKEINNKRQQMQALERQLLEMKENRENDLINRTIQIVMRRGLIEITLTGSFSDFNDSILIHRSDVADINKIIQKKGKKKLLALSNGAMFRRNITMKEWEHKVLKLKVKDLREFVKTIEKCKITKEVQQWLKRKERGWIDDLGEDALKRQIENSINSQEKILADLVKEIALMQNQINQKRKEMKIYDKHIQKMNIHVSEKNFMRDIEFEQDQVKGNKERMSLIINRAKIVRQIQNQHSQLLQLTTILELQRLKTFPTLNAKQNERYQRTYR